ncbi:hypothetical protein OG250_02940 [Streptomyces sp. NBC_00487]|uniref:hypothetical protein n=1 Tax=unclassified Streptomyces TaxID=2593676 RepID=UPI002E16E605|nr:MULTISPECIES: hypothetical protein [unclassified Streptomyces]
MRSVKRWLDHSLTAQAFLIFPVLVGLAALFRPNEHPVYWVVQGGLLSAVTLTVLAVQRRKTGRAVGTDARGIAELQRKLRRREVPREPEERAAMRRLVAEQLGQMERGARWLPYWLGVMGLIAVGLLVLGVASGSWAPPLAFAVGVFAFCSWILWMRRRALDRFRFMRSALRQGEPVS